MSARQQLRDRYRRRGDTQETIIDLRDDQQTVDLRPVESKAADVLRAKDAPAVDENSQLRTIRFFGTPAFRRLWFSQLASSLGDWIGIVALTALASRIGGVAGMSGVSLVLAARLIPGFFFSPIAGVLADKWDRRRLMVVTDFIRAGVLCGLALFLTTSPSTIALTLGLVVASLLLELATLMWSPAKDASVPNIVAKDFLPNANSLSLAAAYGPLLIAGGFFAILVQVPDWIGATGITDESVALYFDAFTYVISAAVIWSLRIPRETLAKKSNEKSAAANGVAEAREGLKYVATNIRVRSVMLGLATGLVGGAMVVPLGQSFADNALDAPKSGYGLLLTGLGIGVAVGVLLISALQKRLPMDAMFLISVFGAATTLFLTASATSVPVAVGCVAALGVCAGSVYVLAYSSIQLNTEDRMRGRVFATLYTSTRICILLALVVAPLLAASLEQLSQAWVDGSVHMFGGDMPLPGVRLTLWLGSIIIFIAGLLAAFSLRRGTPRSSD